MHAVNLRLAIVLLFEIKLNQVLYHTGINLLNIPGS